MAQLIYAHAAASRLMARVISVGILPNGTLAKTPTSKPAESLRARYADIMAGEHELPFTAMKAFRQADLSTIPKGARRLTLKIRRAMPKDVFRGDIAAFPGGIGVREAINRRSLARISKVCAKRVRATPTRVPKILAEPDAAYTHVLASPDAYTDCMSSMGWDIYPPFLDPMENSLLRISHEGRAHSLAPLKLHVAIDYTIPDGSVYCFDARNMLLAMGPGKATYDYVGETFLMVQEYALDISNAGEGVEIIVPVSGRRA